MISSGTARIWSVCYQDDMIPAGIRETVRLMTDEQQVFAGNFTVRTRSDPIASRLKGNDMYFFEKNEAYKNRVFCIDEEGRSFTYGQTWEIGDTMVAKIPQRSLVLLLTANDVTSVSCYLALLRKRCPVILMGRRTDQALIDRMIDTYRPAFVIDEDGAREHGGSTDGKICSNLGLLLSTSGSTGAQKLVRLS